MNPKNKIQKTVYFHAYSIATMFTHNPCIVISIIARYSLKKVTDIATFEDKPFVLAITHILDYKKLCDMSRGLNI